jgi:hypothetical protein
MCAPSWEMLVKKLELNPQKLAFLSVYEPTTLTTANNDRSQVWFRSQPPSQVSHQPKFLSQLSWISCIMDQGGIFGGFKIDKLTASDYHTWKQKIELVLAFRELDEVVFNVVSTNITPPPSPSSGKRMPRPRPSSDSLSAMNIWNMSVGPNHIRNVVGYQECLPAHQFARQIGRPPTLLHCFNGGW